MSLGTIISILVFIISTVLIAVVVPAQEEKKRIENEAGKITKYFGNTEIALFHFLDADEKYGKCGWYVLIEFNSRFDDERDLVKHTNHYEIGYWTEKGANKRKAEEKRVERIIKILPYSISRFDAPIKYSYYRETVQTVDGSYLINKFI